MTNGLLSEIEDIQKETASETIDELKSSVSAIKLLEKVRIKKSVKFADGVTPGEGTSPSGGEGDMPSPPPSALPKDISELGITKKLVAQKVRKKQKRVKTVKTKKKVKVRMN